MNERVSSVRTSTNLFGKLSEALARAPGAILFVDPVTNEQLTRREFANRAQELAHSLRPLVVVRRPVGMLMGNRLEFFLCDFATLLAGGVPVSIYPTSSPEQIAELIEDADLHLIFVDLPRLATLRQALDILSPRDMLVVLADRSSADQMHADTVFLQDLTGLRGAVLLEDADAKCAQDDLVTIIYTSGTTGAPKGVRLTHANVVAAIDSLAAGIGLREGDGVISYLPHAHVAERTLHYYCALALGLRVTICADPIRLPEVLRDVEPTWLAAVPRFWEKLREAALVRLQALATKDGWSLQDALNDGLAVHAIGEAGGLPDAALERRHRLAAEAHWRPLRKALGLSKVRSVNTGGTPTPPHVLNFFAAIGLPLLQLYGMSETCACGTMETVRSSRLGSVGKASSAIEVQIANDGEILLRGDPVFGGYWNASVEGIRSDGWFATGDLGHIDADGYLWVSGRKKDVIINSSGHNMSSHRIEAVLREEVPQLAHAVVIGDGRPFNTALLVFETDDHDMAVLVQSAVGRANARLARVEQIKRFRILRGTWNPGGEELTPTMKLRRSSIGAKYAPDIEGMYARRSDDSQFLEPT